MKRAIASIALALASVAANAQLIVATGIEGLTYSKTFREFKDRCEPVVLQEKNTTGAVQNVDMLVGNQVNVAYGQLDILFMRSLTDNVTTIKTLFALYPEEVHVVALANSLLKEGGMAGFGAKQVVFNRVEDLAGRRVGAWGGSVVTAKLIKLQGNVAFEVNEYTDDKAAKAALDKGEVEALVVVGGQPLGFVTSLSRNYKLLPFSDELQGKLANVYTKSRLNYGNVGATGVQTVATEAGLYAREYKTPRMVAALAAMRQCFYDSLDDLKETTGTHPKWQMVDATNKGKWAWMDLPQPAKQTAKK
jgi:TRAP-type uncharacterized transport system substrate-binding protein